MGGSSTLSLRVDGQIIDGLDQAAESSRASRSKVAREALLLGLSEMSDGDAPEDINVPEHVAHDASIKRLIAEKRKERRSGKFRSEFVKQLKASFKNGEHPEEFRRSVAGYIEETEEMGDLPPGVADETGCDTYREWVDSKLKYYTAAYQASNFDADPLEHPLGSFSGVETAGEWIDRAEEIANAEPDLRGGTTIQEKRARMAGFAVDDGVVPDNVKQEAKNSDRPTREVVASAAVDLIESNRQLTESGSDSDTDTEHSQ